MITSSMSQLLIDAGFTDGWVVTGDVLIFWEHDQDPPAPLVRPETNIESSVTIDTDDDAR